MGLYPTISAVGGGPYRGATRLRAERDRNHAGRDRRGRAAGRASGGCASGRGDARWGRERPAANSVVTVFPRRTPPPRRSARTHAASRPDRQPSKMGLFIWVGRSAVSMMSLTPNGQPSTGDRRSSLAPASRGVVRGAARALDIEGHEGPDLGLAGLDRVDAALEDRPGRIAAVAKGGCELAESNHGVPRGRPTAGLPRSTAATAKVLPFIGFLSWMRARPRSPDGRPAAASRRSRLRVLPRRARGSSSPAARPRGRERGSG